MMKKIQRFGGAMLAPVMLFSFFGIVIGFSLLFSNQTIMGNIAAPNTLWYKIWNVIAAGAWTPFFQLPLLFVVGLPISLAKKYAARASMEALVIYITFNYFINAILTLWPNSFGVDLTQGAIAGSGLTSIAGIITLDTGMIGALLISGIVVYLHNRYYEKELPEMLSIFTGSTFVIMIAFFTMLPLSVIMCFVWPTIQEGMRSMQGFFIESGNFGVFIYQFLQKILIPTGLHHFVYAPFAYDSAVVERGMAAYWASHISDFQTSAHSLKELYPFGGFSLSGMSKVFGTAGLSLAIIQSARPDKKKKVIALIAPAALTAILTGITEPIEFTFLFVAPALWLVHAVLDASIAAVSYAFGVVGDFGGGVINWLGLNWLPLWKFHGSTYITQIIIGLIFTSIWYFVFTFMIKKFDLKTPGRESDLELMKLYSKTDYENKKQSVKMPKHVEQAQAYMDLVGGKDNVIDVTNCATRLRLTVKDTSKVADHAEFQAAGASGLVNTGNGGIQIIVGLTVPTVRESFEKLMRE
ncbi:PTS alpha-glucoside transporter subunit IIBC [Enterococcus hirae]|nr:PTS alpha-glucoside transporter subunit IIBC [Enterococcus hirae]